MFNIQVGAVYRINELCMLNASAAPGVEFALNRRGSDLLVHAVNCVPGSEPEQLDALLDEHPVLADISFSVRLKNTPESVKPLFEDAEVTWKIENDLCHVQLSRLKIHEAVMFGNVYSD